MRRDAACHQANGRARGVALIIVLIMLGVIALMSAAMMRSASSNEMVARNFRLQMLAQQQAESALSYCQAQLLLPDAQRVASLQEASLPPDSAMAWLTPAAWRGIGAAGASLTAVPAEWLKPVPMVPSVPQCMVEKRAGLPGQAYRVTARGYSANYSHDSQGYTSTGMVSWLQTELLVLPVDASPLAVRKVQDRLWTRIINLPFH